MSFFRKKIKGSVLAYSLLVIAVMFSIVTTISIISVVSTKDASLTQTSSQAFQIADGGVQMAVRGINNNLDKKIIDVFPTCNNGEVNKNTDAGYGSLGKYDLSFYTGSEEADKISDCNALVSTITNIKSTGSYKNVAVRAVNVALALTKSCKMISGHDTTGSGICNQINFPSGTFSQTPIVMATPNANAPVSVQNASADGFQGCGKDIGSYSFDWVAYSVGCFN